MSEDIKNDVIPEAVAEVVDNVAEDIVKDALAEAVAEKAAELASAILEDTKPVEAPKPDETVITGPKATAVKEEQALGSVADGVIGTGTKPAAKKAAPKAAPKANPDLVALYSSRNMHWEGVGKLSKGYNIVSKEAAEKWLTKENVRTADPSEVARGYGL